MSLNVIHLRKLLKILFLPYNAQVSAIRADIRDDIAKESGEAGGGGDFYGPFWADAKAHVFGISDLQVTTDGRIAANSRRENLYPRLRDGFLLWWNERRRWTNRPFIQGKPLKSRLIFNDLGATVKIDNILSVEDGNGDEHFIYPYFSIEPILNDESARLGLWVLGQSFQEIDIADIRILDVMRGRTFSIDRNPLLGNEEEEIKELYRKLFRMHAKIREEY